MSEEIKRIIHSFAKDHYLSTEAEVLIYDLCQDVIQQLLSELLAVAP